MALGIQSRATGDARALSAARALWFGVYLPATSVDDGAGPGAFVGRVAGD